MADSKNKISLSMDYLKFNTTNLIMYDAYSPSISHINTTNVI